MEFHVNSPILFILVAVIVAEVLAQSVYFLVKALRRSKELGMDQKKIRKTIRTAAVFTVAPAVAIVISIITLGKKLGLPLPWLRLSVVGSMSYETVAANNALSSMGQSLGSPVPITAQQYLNVFLVMTISIMIGIWLVPLIGKKLQNGMASMGKRDKKWADIFQNAMFIGMIAAFLGFVFCDVSMLWNPVAGINPTAGLVPVAVMAVAAAIMVVLGLAMRKWKWLGDYALPISLVLGMISAIPITAWLG
jgi:heme/copper-type cytochrome/quinol oxidase subunit 2